jgi:hypothetical protein
MEMVVVFSGIREAIVDLNMKWNISHNLVYRLP